MIRTQILITSKALGIIIHLFNQIVPRKLLHFYRVHQTKFKEVLGMLQFRWYTNINRIVKYGQVHLDIYFYSLETSSRPSSKCMTTFVKYSMSRE